MTNFSYCLCGEHEGTWVWRIGYKTKKIRFYTKPTYFLIFPPRLLRRSKTTVGNHKTSCNCGCRLKLNVTLGVPVAEMLGRPGLAACLFVGVVNLGYFIWRYNYNRMVPT